MRPAFQSVNQGGHELINLEKNKQQSVILETLDRVNKNWQALAIKLLNTSAKFDELQEQSEKFYTVFKHVTLWLDDIEVRLVSIPPVGLDPDVLSSQMKDQKVNAVTVSTIRLLMHTVIQFSLTALPLHDLLISSRTERAVIAIH